MSRRSPDRDRRLVVAAVVRRGDGRFLLSRRLPEAHLGGLWEFPGGAVEDGETPTEALQRELAEELGIEVEVGTPVTFAFHRDTYRDVVLLFYRARVARGEPTGRQGQEVGWFTCGELARLATPPADAELVAKLAIEGGKGKREKGKGMARTGARGSVPR
jgi:8-oxo-dGTP diphosphatase